MYGLKGLRFAIILLYLVNAFLLLVSWLSVSGIWKASTQYELPVLLLIMGSVPIAMLACSLAATALLTRFRLSAVWPLLLLASSPIWPFLIATMDSAELFDDIPITGAGMTWIWFPLALLFTFYVWVLGKKNVLQ